jgi:hypothetical protein
MSRIKFESKTFSWFYAITFVRVKNHDCLSRGVYVTNATWHASRFCGLLRLKARRARFF